MAGRIAFRKAMEQAQAHAAGAFDGVEIAVPDEFAGSIMGDLNSRRGRIQGMDNKAGSTLVKAQVPMAEMLTYGVDLTSMTQGRGSFSMEMTHYDVVPAKRSRRRSSPPPRPPAAKRWKRKSKEASAISN
jgi:elongation factor G